MARHEGGRFILRIDDTDRARSDVLYVDGIREDLAWLGLDWDALEHQSARIPHYEAAFETLAARGRVYPCYETPEELEARREARLKRGLPPVYDGAAKKLRAEERDAFEAEGRVPHWRFALEAAEISFDDKIAGPRRFLVRNLGDPVVRRADGSFTYLFASAVDDIELGISDVIRGQDHLSNTPLQIELTQALDRPVPVFAHLPLILDAGGEKFSKRLGSLSLRSMRQEGIDPHAVILVLAALGTATAAEAGTPVDDLVRGFDLGAYGNAAARLDVQDIRRLTVQRLQQLDAERIGMMLGHEVEPALWRAVSANIERLEDVEDWRRTLMEPIDPMLEDGDYSERAAALLPEDLQDYDGWIAALKRDTGRKGKALFHPLRLALTGRDHGPELRVLLPLIGRDRAIRRLRGERA